MFDTIWEIIQEYGWFAGIFVGILALLGKIIVGNFKKWISPPPTDPTAPEQVIKRHQFFANADYRMRIEIPSLELIKDKPIRERIFKDLLQIAFKSIYDTVTEMVAAPSVYSGTAEQWMDHTTKYVNKILIDTENNARAEEVPEEVVKVFFKWLGTFIESLQECIPLLTINNVDYPTNAVKMSTLLLLLNLLLVSILGDAERILSEINGEITGLNYKGQIIE